MSCKSCSCVFTTMFIFWWQSIWTCYSLQSGFWLSNLCQWLKALSGIFQDLIANIDLHLKRYEDDLHPQPNQIWLWTLKIGCLLLKLLFEWHVLVTNLTCIVLIFVCFQMYVFALLLYINKYFLDCDSFLIKLVVVVLL